MENNLLIGGIPLVLLVFGMVEFIKKLGLAGVWLTLCSMLFGILFGIAYQVTVSGWPVTISEWIVTVTLGLAIGLTASGVYDFFSTMRHQDA